MMDGKENEPLIYNSERNDSEAYRLKKNFYVMCIAFSANHGCVVACLAYASTELGDLMGGYGGGNILFITMSTSRSPICSTGALYVCYSIASFLFSKPVISMVGPRNGLIVGVGGYCVYVAGFLVAVVLPAVRWPAFLIAASIGGMAGGFLWTAQGRYFSRNALLYSTATDTPLQEVNSNFAGIFATCYLGLECITKVLATLIFLSMPSKAPAVIFTIYTAIAFLATFAITRLDELGDLGTWDFDTDVIRKNTVSTGRLMYSDVRLSLLIPFQVHTLLLRTR